MKKNVKIIIGILVILIILAILLFPKKYEMNDGGSVEYKAILYEYTKIHRLNEKSDDGYENGKIFKILGKEVYNNVGIATIKSNPYIKETKETAEYIFSKNIENISIKLTLPANWQYEELQRNESNDFYTYGIKFYKNDSEGQIELYYYKNMFGVCGTDLTTKELVLNNGKKAFVGYYGYSAQKDISWSYISMGEINKNIAFQNSKMKLEDADEFLNIVKTIEIEEKNTQSTEENNGDDVEGYEFVGEIIETGENYIIVKPDANTQEIKSADKISISITRPTNGLNDFYMKGNKVKITYNGVVLETYPAKIRASNIELASLS